MQAGRHHEESDDEEAEWTEEEDASTPLDPIDPFIAFADTLEGLRLQDPARLQVHSIPKINTLKSLCEHPGGTALQNSARLQVHPSPKLSKP